MSYEIVLPKDFAEIAPPLKKHHDRLSTAVAHVYDMINNNDYDLLLDDPDPILNGHDLAIAYRKHFKTDIAIIAINKIN